MAAILVIVAGVVVLALWAMYAHGPRGDDNGIVFREPRVNLPGHRLGEYRRRKAIADPQVIEGNKLDWVKFRADAAIRKQAGCDHLFWPVEEMGVLIGQRCALCKQFHTLAEVLDRIAPMHGTVTDPYLGYDKEEA